MAECKMCKGAIDKDASICKHCGSDQKLFYRFIKNTGLINIVSVIVLIFSFLQYDNARIEKNLAEKANSSAQASLKSIDSLNIKLQKITRLYLEVSFLQANKGIIHADGGISYPRIYNDKIDSLSMLIEPNLENRKKWINNLSQIRNE